MGDHLGVSRGPKSLGSLGTCPFGVADPLENRFSTICVKFTMPNLVILAQKHEHN